MNAILLDVNASFPDITSTCGGLAYWVAYWVAGAKMKDWNVYSFQIMVIGDRQAAVLLQVVIRMTCGICKSIYIRAAEKTSLLMTW